MAAKGILFTGLILLLTGQLAGGQSLVNDFHLIPQPKAITVQSGRFDFEHNLKISVNSLNNIGLGDFCELLKTELGIFVIINGRGPGSSIRIAKRPVAGLQTGDQGYVLTVKPREISIFAETEAGFFYGIQTLSQLITSDRTGRSIPCMRIVDYPDIPIRGWQDDISRGPIPTMDFLKKEIRVLSSFKLNAMTLYTEDVFKLRKHPTLAPDDGITEEQIAELSEYAAKYHVELIGNFQSFGHMNKILSKPGYEHLAESGHILTPTREESYRFLEEVYSEVVPAYSSPYFHINCDETFGLGETVSKKMADSLGIGGIYGYHINRLNDLLKPYHKRILMWGDIASDPEIVSLLPKDITVISWGYHDASSFDYAIRPFSDQGLNFWVAPGINSWGTVFPNLKVATVNINNYIRDGYKLGATGVLNTSWMDDGLNFFENNWHGLVWGAEKSWNPMSPAPEHLQDPRKPDSPEPVLALSAGKFDNAFDKIFFGTGSASVTSWMQSFSSLHQSRVRDIARSGRVFEPVLPFYPEYVDENQMEMNGAILDKLDSLEALLPSLNQEVKKNRLSLDYLDFALSEVRFAAQKNIFRIELYRYVNGLNGAIPAENIKATLKILIRQSEQLKNRYAHLWKLINRDWWLDRNLGKFDQLAEDLRDLRGQTILTVADTISAAGRMVSMRSLLDNLPVYYTLDGTIPSVSSMRYSGPVHLRGNATVRARVISEGREFPEITDHLILHKAVGKLHRLNSIFSTYHPAYDAGGELGLLDGRTGSVEDIRSGRWQGYSGQDINLEIDLGKTDTLNYLSMGFYQTTVSWVILPKRLDVFFSDDGIDYQKFVSLTHNIPADLPEAVVHHFETSLNGLKTRYLKIVGVYYGPLPEFHNSKGEPSMMFADEIIVR